MKNNIETFEKELNSIIGICDEKIKRYKALLEEYEALKGSALSLLNLNNNTKGKDGKTHVNPKNSSESIVPGVLTPLRQRPQEPLVPLKSHIHHQKVMFRGRI
ncbi:MAG: hypothetical protein KIH08_06400 [Candidatus Freyarchaeota archaeon]|nr:hypothetical protein [Candidatus Jordarchaeia archaeon]MBS7269246.1 hypothetical protein [Candidatus Jordarchaeia archaeon]MBS7280116.1 hypothetical protein [Candidatus Jordarchaeia archaeon]